MQYKLMHNRDANPAKLITQKIWLHEQHQF